MGNVARIRTLKETFSEIKRLDPDTAITMSLLKRSIRFIPGCFKCGNKWLLNMDEVEKYFADPERLAKDRQREYEQAQQSKGIRAVVT